MKKIIVIMMLCISCFTCDLFAGDNSIKTHLTHTLNRLFEISNKKSVINAYQYEQKTFVYNGMPVTVFKSKNSDWTGYFKRLTPNQLPANSLLQIKNKYNNAKIQKAILYFNNEGELSYFAVIILKDKCIVLKIKESGSVKVF